MNSFNKKTFHPFIFDFNGTLFWDSPFHDRTWRGFALKYTGKNISADEMKSHIHGRTNKDILTYVFGEELSEGKILEYTDEKESLYRKLVSSDEGLFDLAPGAETFLDSLKNNDIPRTIATSSERTNVEFFFKHLDLNKWFDFSKVVFDDGTDRPKPAPDKFIKAAKKIGQNVEDCVILEDSVAGLKAGIAAKAYKVIFVGDELPPAESDILSEIDGRITHFNQIEHILNKK